MACHCAVMLCLLVLMIIFLIGSGQNLHTHLCPPGVDENISANECWKWLVEAMLNLITTLGWRALAISLDNSTDMIETLLPKLHSGGVLTMVTEDCLHVLSRYVTTNGSGILIFGSYRFVQQTFIKITTGISQGNLTSAMLFWNWLTVIPAEHVQSFNGLVKSFQNIAVIASQQDGQMSLWKTRYAQNDSELCFVSTLPLPAPQLLPQRISPNPSHGLGGRLLKVVVKELGSSLFKKMNGSYWTYQGVLIDMLKELSICLNFSYILIPPPDKSWGQKLDNGQWDGPIGMLTRKEADMALGAFTQSYERSLVADALTPFMFDNAVIVFRKQLGSTTNHWVFFLQPFQTMVYVVIGLSLVGMLLSLLLLERWQESLSGVLGKPYGRETTFNRIVEYTGLLLAGLLKEPFHQRKTVTRAGSVLVVTWLFLGVVLASVYSSQLTSSLTVSDNPIPFNSMAQLLAQDAFTWGVSSGTAQESILQSSQNPEFQAFYRGVQDFAKSDPTMLSRDYEVQKNKVFTQRYAYFTATVELLETWSAEVCGLTMIPETYMTFSVGPFLQKGSPYTRVISDEIGRMVDSGLVDYWRRKWKPEKRQCDPDDGQSSREIGLADIQTAFYLAALGLGMAVVVLGLEHFLQRLRNSYNEKKQTVNQFQSSEK